MRFMNKILTHEDFLSLKKHHHLLKSVRNDCWYKENEDALLKWSSILSSIQELGIYPKKIVDLGCGQSNLTLVIDKMLEGGLEEVYLLDVEPANKLFLESKKCKYLQGNILQTAYTIQEESIDLAIDSCAVTHFKSTCEVSANDGILETAKILSRILKVGGYFISASDILSFKEDTIYGEFISASNMISLYESQGLTLVSDFNETFDNAFLLSDLNAGRGKGLAVGSFVFRKMV